MTWRALVSPAEGTATASTGGGLEFSWAGASPLSYPITVSFWARWSDTQSFKTLFASDTGRIQVYFDGSVNDVLARHNGSTVFSQENVFANVWHHYHFIFGGATNDIEFYLDGTLRDSVATSTDMEFTNSNATIWLLQDDGGDSDWDGRAASFQIIDGEYSPSDCTWAGGGDWKELDSGPLANVFCDLRGQNASDAGEDYSSNGNDWTQTAGGGSVTLDDSNVPTLFVEPAAAEESALDSLALTLGGGAATTEGASALSGSSLSLAAGDIASEGASALDGASVALTGGEVTSGAVSALDGGSLALTGGAAASEAASALDGSSLTLGGADVTTEGVSALDGASLTLTGGDIEDIVAADESALDSLSLTLGGGDVTSEGVSQLGGSSATLAGGAATSIGESALGGSSLTVSGGEIQTPSISTLDSLGLTLTGGEVTTEGESQLDGAIFGMGGAVLVSEGVSQLDGGALTLTGGGLEIPGLDPVATDAPYAIMGQPQIYTVTGEPQIYTITGSPSAGLGE